MEKQLVAAVRILLPSSKFVVHGKRHALLEAFASPGRKTDDVAVDLETQRHVEIFGNVGLGPEFLVAIFVEEGDLLDSGPAENSIVADEGGDVAVGHCVLDSRVDQVREEGNTGQSQRGECM